MTEQERTPLIAEIQTSLQFLKIEAVKTNTHLERLNGSVGEHSTVLAAIQQARIDRGERIDRIEENFEKFCEQQKSGVNLPWKYFIGLLILAIGGQVAQRFLGG